MIFVSIKQHKRSLWCIAYFLQSYQTKHYAGILSDGIRSINFQQAATQYGIELGKAADIHGYCPNEIEFVIYWLKTR